MKTVQFVLAAVSLAGCASILSACATSPPSDTVRDQYGQQRVAPITNFHVVDVVDSKALYRGAQPNDEQWKFLADLGVKTVLKLNEYVGATSTLEQERQAAEKYGIRLVPLTMQPEDFPNNLNPSVMPANDQVRAALAVMEDARNRPLYIHCSHGRDRTGLLVAMYRVRQNNYCKDKAFAEMKALGHNSLLPGLKKTLYLDDTVENASCLK